MVGEAWALKKEVFHGLIVIPESWVAGGRVQVCCVWCGQTQAEAGERHVYHTGRLSNHGLWGGVHALLS